MRIFLGLLFVSFIGVDEREPAVRVTQERRHGLRVFRELHSVGLLRGSFRPTAAIAIR